MELFVAIMKGYIIFVIILMLLYTARHQEEAPALGKLVLVMRDTTERPEGVEAGTLKLAGTKMDDIYRECRQLLTEPEIYRKMSKARNPYGDGTASIKIRKILEDINA